MVNHCANSGCAKPLHYLREGRIFIFDVATGSSETGGKRMRHLEHYWLCGTCSRSLTLAQGANGIRVLPKPAIQERKEFRATGSALLS